MIYTQQDYNNLVELLLFYDLEDMQEINKILKSSNLEHLKIDILNAIELIDNKIDYYYGLENTWIKPYKLFSLPNNFLEYKEILANRYSTLILNNNFKYIPSETFTLA